jgi:hypothetical protein
MPDQACYGPDTDKEQHGSRGEQEACEPHKQAHYIFIRSILDQPKVPQQALPSRREFSGLLKQDQCRTERRLPNGILVDSGTPCGVFIKRPPWPN